MIVKRSSNFPPHFPHTMTDEALRLCLKENGKTRTFQLFSTDEKSAKFSIFPPVEKTVETVKEEPAPVKEEAPVEVVAEEPAIKVIDKIDLSKFEKKPAKEEKPAEPAPAPEPEPTKEEVLLAEIRDLLKEKK